MGMNLRLMAKLRADLLARELRGKLHTETARADALSKALDDMAIDRDHFVETADSAVKVKAELMRENERLRQGLLRIEAGDLCDGCRGDRDNIRIYDNDGEFVHSCQKAIARDVLIGGGK